MDYQEVLENAKRRIGPNCRVCRECNGLACADILPGPGAKKPGNVANDNFEAWRKIKLNMDTLVTKKEIDTSCDFFGRKLTFPLVSGPIGSLAKQFNPNDDIIDFNDQCMAACEHLGLLHFYSSGLEDAAEKDNERLRLKHGNAGIPIINPDDDEDIMRQIDHAKSLKSPLAIGIVVDSAGLPHLNKIHGNSGTKSIEQIQMFKKRAQLPLIIKGIMSATSALKALEAGADAIIVSNHGGRVLSDVPSTAEVLPEIVKAVDKKAKIIVDGGIRNGLDLFKAYALGADLCLICRPVLIAYYGGRQEGIEAYFNKLLAELKDTMYMCGARKIADINRSMVRVPVYNYL